MQRKISDFFMNKFPLDDEFATSKSLQTSPSESQPPPIVAADHAPLSSEDEPPPDQAQQSSFNGKFLAEDFQASREAMGKAPPPRREQDLPNDARQGHWPKFEDMITNDIAFDPSLRDMIDIDPNNRIDPDRDIEPTGAFELMQSSDHEDLVEVYGPNGKFIATLTIERAAVLRAAYFDPIRSSEKSHLDEHDFAQALAKLMLRYKDGHKDHGARTKMKIHWATPDVYMKALQQELSLDTERFASPLNFTPSMQHYFSLYASDSVFGANHNAFGCPWIGASQCNPEYEPEDMDKVVRWAIASANRSEEPCLTAFVLPWWENSSYFKWMAHPRVQTLARIPGKQFLFKKPDHWRTGETYAGHPKWDVHMFVVANDAGIQKFVRPRELQRWFTQASIEIGKKACKVVIPQPRHSDLRNLMSYLAGSHEP